MGLYTTHGCWAGSYTAFHRWRETVAKAAGFPPLEWMQGFWEPGSARDPLRPEWSKSAHDYLTDRLPLSWEAFGTDPLVKLLSHSDDDGRIASADCGPIADRLAALLLSIPVTNDGVRDVDWRETTQRFIDGLVRASVAGEDVEFH